MKIWTIYFKEERKGLKNFMKR